MIEDRNPKPVGIAYVETLAWVSIEEKKHFLPHSCIFPPDSKWKKSKNSQMMALFHLIYFYCVRIVIT